MGSHPPQLTAHNLLKVPDAAKPHEQCKSSSSCDISEVKDSHYVPMPPLDLFDGKAHVEPNLHPGFRRQNLMRNKDFLMNEEDQVCQHTANVVDWFCKDCNAFVPQFDCIFDDFQGRVSQYLKVCYENGFLEDFLHA